MATRIAVVDHDPAFLTLLQEVLSADGYEVQRLYIGIGAHEILRAFAPAALILDIPRDDPAASWQLLGIVRDDAALDPIPRVVCVERDQVRAHTAALQGHGAATLTAALQGHGAATLTKPFALDDLLYLVHRMAGGPDRDRRDDRDPTRAGRLDTGAA